MTEKNKLALVARNPCYGDFLFDCQGISGMSKLLNPSKLLGSGVATRQEIVTGCDVGD